MINSLNTALYTGMLSAKAIMTNIKNNTIIEESVHNNNSIVEFKSLFSQIQAMVELDNSNPYGKKLNIII